jgi:prepilin-type N-terminal cleavage/methylation domain-containing protein
VRQRLRAARQDESGFTLIELLIVIVILGVLAGVVVFAVNGITDRGVTAACKADKTTVAVAVEAYYAKNAAYPAGADDNARIGALVPAFLHSIPDQNLVVAPAVPKYVITLDANGVVGPANCP